MKAKLSKEGGGYDLYRIDEDGKRVTFASTQYYKQKLSLKNCQSIERGYDLDELADEYIIVKPKYREHEHNMRADGFKAGFQKALSIIGDKKFSEEDMKKAYLIGCDKQTTSSYHVEKNIQSLQQTEWEVEIEMCIEYTEGGYPVRSNTPKLDADGCLILKRK